MKIRVESGEFKINVILPTALVFSRGSAWLANHVGRKYSGNAMDQIPPEALKLIFAEFRRIKRKHGKWKLVEIDSSEGDRIRIEL